MIPLDDPLWAELPDGRRSRDVAPRLGALLARWTKDDAFDLEDDLTIGDKPSPAAIAAVPHLVSATEGTHGKRAATGAPDILATIFTMRSSLACRRADAERFPEPMNGVRRVSEDSWETKLSPDLVERLEADMRAALPAVRSAIATKLRSSKREAATRLLSGLAGAWDEHIIARALDFGEDGIIRCETCGDCCLWMAFPGKIAIYENWDEGKKSPEMLDLDDNAPNRANGFFEPNPGAVLSVGARALWDAADRDETRAAHDVVRHMLGRFPCPRCGASSAPHLL